MIAEIVNPDYRFSSISKITPEWLRVHKYRAVLMDIDNTLAARNSWAVPEKHIDWLQKLQEQDIRIVQEIPAEQNSDAEVPDIYKCCMASQIQASCP